MDPRRGFIAAFILAAAASAQTPAEAVRSAIARVRYSPLAEAARIQGDVHLTVNSGTVTVLSGPPLLIETSLKTAIEIAAYYADGNPDVTLHFVLADPVTSVAVPKRNAVHKAVMRVFGMSNKIRFRDHHCEESAAPPNEFRITGSVIEIRVYGRSRCIQTEAAFLVYCPRNK